MKKYLFILLLLPTLLFAQAKTGKVGGDHRPLKEYYLSKNGVPGDSTDVTTALQNLMSGKRNSIFIADTNRTYYFTYANDSIVIPEGCTFDGRGSKFHFEIDSTSMAFSFGGNNITFKNTTIDVDSLNDWVDADNGQYGTALSIGQYANGIGYNGWTIENCSFESDRPEGNAILITGDSYNGTFINPVFPTSNNTRSFMEFHWGGASLVDTTTEPFVTTHPHNISVINPTINGSTRANSQGITLSACWNINVTGGVIKDVKRGIFIIAGDYGFLYADTSKYHHFDYDLWDYGSTFDQVSCYQTFRGFQVRGDNEGTYTKAADDSVITRFPITFTNCFTQGQESTPSMGFLVQFTTGVTIDNCVATNHTSGAVVGQEAYNTTIKNCDFYGNSSWVIDVGTSTGLNMPDQTTILNNRLWASPGIYTNYSLRTHIVGNRFGQTDEATMANGIFVDNDTALNQTSIMFNHGVDFADGADRSLLLVDDLTNIGIWLDNTVDTSFIDTTILSGSTVINSDNLVGSVVLRGLLDTTSLGLNVQDTTGNIQDNYIPKWDDATKKILWEADAGTGGEINTLSDSGTYNSTEGFGLAAGKVGSVLNVKGLIEGSNITITKSSDSGLIIATVALNDSHNHTTTTISGLLNIDMADEALNPDKLVGDATDDNFVDVNVGGTGFGVATAGGVIVGDGTNDLKVTPTMTNATIMIGDADNIPTIAALSGDVTMTNGGVVTIGADKIDSTKIIQQGVHPKDLDSTADYTIGSMFKVNSAVSDSQYVTKNYADNLSGTGEVNTLADSGTFNGTEGFGLTQTKSGTELKIRGLIEGTNISMVNSGDTGLTITTNNILDTTNVLDIIRDSLGDYRYITLEVVHGNPSNTDSVYLSLPLFSSSTFLLFSDSSTEGSDKDSVVVSGTVPGRYEIDSVVFCYKAIGTSVQIDSIAVLGPTLSGTIINTMDSSVAYTGFNTGWAATSVTRVAIDITNIQAEPGYRYGIKFINGLAAANGRIHMYYVQLVCKP